MFGLGEIQIKYFHKLTSTTQGVDMVSVIHEQLGQEEFNEKFWKGTMYWDDKKGFYSALG